MCWMGLGQVGGWVGEALRFGLDTLPSVVQKILNSLNNLHMTVS